MTSAFSWQNSISLWRDSFLTPRPNLPVTPGVSWLPTFVFQSPMMKRTSLSVLVLEGLVRLHRTIQLWYHWLGHRLGLLWCWMVCLGNELKWFCCFGDCSPVLHFRLLFTTKATHFLPRDSCPSVQFSRSVVSNSLQPHESQHARLPCPSPAPGVHSDSRPSSPWCHPTISSSVVPFSSCP